MGRLYLCVGDQPETGGYIEPRQGLSVTMGGQQAALVGDQAYCNACKSIGVIAKTGQDPQRHACSLLDNSCSSNVADVLNLIGIVAYDPRWSAFGMISPQDIAVGLSHSKRVKEKRFYPKDGS